jgi:TatD DNase family protein
VARKLPQDRILVETDSPYLAPVPHRGKSNTPIWVRHVAEMLADVRGEPLSQVAEYTRENTRRFLGITS